MADSKKATSKSKDLLKSHVPHVPKVDPRSEVTKFLDFVREQGVVGLAIGLLIGVAVKDTADTLVAGIVNPLIGLILPQSDSLGAASFHIGGAQFMWGAVASSMLNLMVVALVIYVAFKLLGLEKLDKKKS